MIYLVLLLQASETGRSLVLQSMACPAIRSPNSIPRSQPYEDLALQWCPSLPNEGSRLEIRETQSQSFVGGDRRIGSRLVRRPSEDIWLPLLPVDEGDGLLEEVELHMHGEV